MQSEVFSGARCVFKLGGQPVGYALGVNGSTGINYQPLNILGHIEVQEHIPIAYTVEMSANLARLARFTRLNAAQSFPGLRPDVEGGTTSPQIMPGFGQDGRNIIQSGELTAVIYDHISQGTLYTISGAKCSQKNWDITAAGSVAENCTFVARIANEGGELNAAIGQ